MPATRSLEDIPDELLNLFVDELVLSRTGYHGTDSCCRNSAPCCRHPGTSCGSLLGTQGLPCSGVREVGPLLLTSKALNKKMKTLPSFLALKVACSVKSGRFFNQNSRQLALTGKLCTERAGQWTFFLESAPWVRSLYLREILDTVTASSSLHSVDIAANLAATSATSHEVYISSLLAEFQTQNFNGCFTTSVNGAACSHWMCRLLTRCTGLVSLHLPHWFNDSLSHTLISLTALKTLCLRGCEVTDETLVEVGKFEQLQELDLSSTSISGSGIQHLANLKILRLLNLSFCHLITDSSAVHLQKLTDLRELYLCGTPITDDTLWALSALRRLAKADLTHCESVSDHGIGYLCRVLAGNHAREAWMATRSAWGRGFMEVAL